MLLGDFVGPDSGAIAANHSIANNSEIVGYEESSSSSTFGFPLSAFPSSRFCA